MPIRKDKTTGIWQLDIRTPGGQRVRRSTETTDRKAAQEYHDKLKASLWRQNKLGEQPDRTFEEAAVRFLHEVEGQRDYAAKLRHVAYWRDQFAGRAVRSLTASDIVDALPTHRVMNGAPAKSLTGATRNRYVATIKRILNLCVQWEWIDRVPRLPHYKEPDVRVRWESPEVITKLIRALRLPWMRDAAIVAAATGMRADELLSLEVSQVDLAKRTTWVTHAEAKSKRARSVPLNDDAVEVLERRLKTAQRFVFTRGGRDARIPQIYWPDFMRACDAIGLADFRWHDLRHTWASWHVQRGTPLMVLKELGGWETIQMVQKYAHLGRSHIAAHAEAVNFWSMSGIREEKTPQDKVA